MLLKFFKVDNSFLEEGRAILLDGYYNLLSRVYYIIIDSVYHTAIVSYRLYATEILNSCSNLCINSQNISLSYQNIILLLWLELPPSSLSRSLKFLTYVTLFSPILHGMGSLGDRRVLGFGAKVYIPLIFLPHIHCKIDAYYFTFWGILFSQPKCGNKMNLINIS